MQTNIVYTVDRHTNDLYAYDWDPVAKTLTLKSGYPVDLPNCVGAYGIAFDDENDLLYVADGDGGYVRVYDVNTWTEVDSFAVSHSPIGIAVDPGKYVYTVAGFGGSYLLSQFDLNTRTESTVDMGHGGMGVAVDWATGLVYVSGGYYGDDVSVWDPTTLTQTYSTGDIGDPTGICVPQEEVSYNPLHLTKDDGLTQVNPGQQITYDICFDNSANNYDVNNVEVVDQLPSNAAFVSASSGGVYDAGTHTVTWDIGTLSAGAPQQCVQLTVQVDSSAQPGDTVVNSCTIDSDETPPTTTSDTDNVVGQPSVPEFPPFAIAALGLLGAIILLRRK